MATRSKTKSRELFKRIIFSIRNSLIIYGPVLNYPSRRKKRSFQISFDNNFNNLGKKILEDLRRDGIAFSHIDYLFPNTDLGKSFADWIKANEDKLMEKDDKKSFLLTYFGPNPHEVFIEKGNPFFDFFLSDKILFLCSEYLGYLPQFNHLAIEKTIPSIDLNSPRHSQNWHRDPEEKRTMKVFIYVNDVDETNGPFTYIKSSQPSSNSRFAKLFPQALPHGSYPDATSLNSLIHANDVVLATGKAGTVIFCDTAGIHRGGLAEKGERIMATGFYPSRRWSEKPRVKRPAGVDLTDYGKMATDAVL